MRPRERGQCVKLQNIEQNDKDEKAGVWLFSGSARMRKNRKCQEERRDGNGRWEFSPRGNGTSTKTSSGAPVENNTNKKKTRMEKTIKR